MDSDDEAIHVNNAVIGDGFDKVDPHKLGQQRTNLPHAGVVFSSRSLTDACIMPLACIELLLDDHQHNGGQGGPVQSATNVNHVRLHVNLILLY